MKLQVISNKKKNIANIGRLTSTIQTISMVKKQQSKKLHDKILNPFIKLKNKISTLNFKPFSNKTLHIIFTVDKKLCKNFIYLASSYLSNIEYLNDDTFICFGKHALDSLKNVKNKVIFNIINSIEDAYSVSEYILEKLFENHKIKLHFYSMKHDKFINKDMFDGVPYFDNTEELNTICKLYISYYIQIASTETSMIENTSRAVAMSQASDTCKNMQHQLKLDYNKLRQEKITLEMSEIIGGTYESKQ